MKTILTAAIALFLAGTAGAADYLVYKDSSGGIVLSNIAPPDSAQIRCASRIQGRDRRGNRGHGEGQSGDRGVQSGQGLGL